MEAHKHGHLYRQRDVHQVIARFGNRPAPEVRAELRNSLAQLREEYLARQSRQARGPARGREESGASR